MMKILLFILWKLIKNKIFYSLLEEKKDQTHKNSLRDFKKWVNTFLSGLTTIKLKGEKYIIGKKQ